jgi:hypothetical protein
MTNENYRPIEQGSPMDKADDNTKLLLADADFFQPKSQNPNTLTDTGIIDSLVVPNSWVRDAEGTMPSHPRHVDFRKDESTLLSFREKGYRVSEKPAGEHFTQSLAKSLDAKTNERQIDIKKEAGATEFAGLSPILADDLVSSRTFQTENVRVVQLNGRNVLEITGTRGKTTEQGEWQSSGTKVASIYIDKFGKGDAIQEIRLEAPVDSFAKLKADLDKSLRTIKWKDAAIKS